MSTGFSPGGGGGAGWAAGAGGGAAVYIVSSGGGGGGGQNRTRGDAQPLYSGSGQVGQGLIQLMPAGTATTLGCAGNDLQTYNPPSGTAQVVVIAVGGQGSRGHNRARVGHPAVVEGLVDILPGESLDAFVGCSGDTESRAGFGFGGDSGDSPIGNDGGGAGGGTAVNGGDGGMILVAGGGGGTGGDWDGTGRYGGNGGFGWGRNGAQAGQAGQGTFGNNGDGGCGGCENTWNGGEGDNADGVDFGGAGGGGGGGGFWGGAGGQASFNSAGGGGGAGSSYAGGRLQNPGIGTAGVNHSQGDGAVVFVAVPPPQAGLTVTKAVTGAGSPAYSSGPFQLQSTCTHDGTTVLDVTDTLGPGAIATHDGLPIGTECT